MKKAGRYLLILCVCFSFTSNAQTYLGFKTGLISTPFIGYVNAKYHRSKLDYQQSYTVSGMYKDQFSHHFSIGANISYDYYQADYSTSWYSPTGESGSKEVYYQFGYLGFLFYPQLNFGKKLSFYCNAGFYYGILTNAHATGEEIDGNAKEDIQQNPFGFISAIGLQYTITESWNIVMDISGKRTQCYVQSPNIKNQIDVYFSLGFFYKILNNSMLDNKKTTPNN